MPSSKSVSPKHHSRPRRDDYENKVHKRSRFEPQKDSKHETSHQHSSYKLYVGNLPQDVHEQEIRSVFHSIAPVSNIIIPRSHHNEKRSPAQEEDHRDAPTQRYSRKKFAFIYLNSLDDATKVCLYGSSLSIRGHQLKVDSVTNTHVDGNKRHKSQPVDTKIHHNREDAGTDRKGQSSFQRSGSHDNKNVKYEWGKNMCSNEYQATNTLETKLDPLKEKEENTERNFQASGLLSKQERTTDSGIELKFEEPMDAAKPHQIRWRLYAFKDGKAVPDIPNGYYQIHRKSCYLLGRDPSLVDIALNHPSCSKQHAVIQFRWKKETDDDDENDENPAAKNKSQRKDAVKPYLMDLESANGTLVNGKRIEPRRYYQLLEKDLLQFGSSTREYVLLHDNMMT